MQRNEGEAENVSPSMVALLLPLALGQLHCPTPAERVRPRTKDVALRISPKDLSLTLVNLTDKRLAWSSGGFLIAAFAKNVAGGPVREDPRWRTYRRPTIISAAGHSELPPKAARPFGKLRLDGLHLGKGRYRVWATYYPALEREEFLSSPAVTVDVP